MVVCSVEIFIETNKDGLFDRSILRAPLNVRTHSTYFNGQVTTYHQIRDRFDEHVNTFPRMRQFPHVTTTLCRTILCMLDIDDRPSF